MISQLILKSLNRCFSLFHTHLFSHLCGASNSSNYAIFICFFSEFNGGINRQRRRKRGKKCIMKTVLITYRKVIFCFYPQYDIHSPPCQFCVSVALSVLTSSAWGSSLLKSWHGCQLPGEQGEALGSSWCRLLCSWASMQSHWGLGKLATLALAVQSSFHPQTALMLPSVDPSS